MAGLARIANVAARWVTRVLDLLHHALLWLIIAILATQSVLLIIQVTARYFFSASQHWIDETARLGLVWLVFLGAAVLIRERRHMAISFFVDKLSPRLQVAVDIATAIILIAVFALLLTGGPSAWDAASRLKTPSLGLPRTVLVTPVLIGFFLSLAFSVELLVRLVSGAGPPKQLIPDDELD